MSRTIRSSRILVGIALALVACGMIGGAASAQPNKKSGTAFVGARLVTLAGPDIARGTILVRDGKIVRVGKSDLDVPSGYERIDVSGHVIMPGMIDLHNHLGARGGLNEMIDAMTPDFHAADAFDPFAGAVTAARDSGVTTFVLAPGDSNIVGGRTAVVKLPTASTVRPTYLRRTADVKMSLGRAAFPPNRAPTSRAAAVAMLRAKIADGGLPALASKDTRAFVHVTNAAECESALALAKAGGFALCLVHADDVAQAAKQIGAARAAVAFGPFSFAHRDRQLGAPAAVAAAGGRVGFASNAPLRRPHDLRVTAALAVRHGLDRRVALRGLTLTAAEIAGVAKRVGSLEAGKDADLVVLSGDPLDLTSHIARVVIGGETAFERESPKSAKGGE